MSEQVTDLFEARLRAAIRNLLDAEAGPHPGWAEAPAARRVATGEGRVRRLPPLRLLAIAAVLAVGGTAATFGALRLLPTTNTNPFPTPPVPPLPTMAVESLIAHGYDGYLRFGRPGGDPDAFRYHGGGCPQFLRDGTLLISDVSDPRTEWRILALSIGSDSQITGPLFTVPIDQVPDLSLVCFKATPGAQRFAFLEMPDNVRPTALFIVNRDPFTLERVVAGDTPADAEVRIGAMAWSASGDELLIARVMERFDPVHPLSSDLWIIPVTARGEQRHVASLPGEVVHDVAWSPGGGTIAFRSEGVELTALDSEPILMTTGSFVRVMDVDDIDGQATLVDEVLGGEPGLSGGPAWSLDGSRMGWVLGGELRVGGADGGDWRGLPQMSSDELGIGWASGPVIWSPDGTHVLVGQADDPAPGADAQHALVIYDVLEDGQPQVYLPWRPERLGRVAWQGGSH